MATGRARSKLQRLLKELALEDSTTALPETPVRGAGGEDDAASDEPDSSSVFSSELSSPGGHNVQQAAAAAERYQHLERRAMQLMQDHRALQAKHQQHVVQSEATMSDMRAQYKKALEEMEQRHREVEARAPAVKAKLEDFRGRMQDLRISEAQYQELLAMPEEGLHLVDQIKVAVYEQTRDVARDAESLRLALASSRDACSRMEADMARARAEATRAAATLVEKDKEMQAAMESYQARVSRLSSELEQAMIRAELNSAKGAMYDELRAKAERLELDNQRLQVVEATARRAEQQAVEAEKLHRAREHSVEMLHMDKAYLTKQVEFMSDQQRKMQGELEMREQQVSELQRSRQELYEKLVTGEHNRGRQDESRLHQELERLQAATHADLERIRLETTETYEREARLLREMRDQAVEEAGRLRIAHAELKDHLERARSMSAEVQRQLESQVVELQSELRQKAFELGHLRVVLGEKEQLLNSANLQVDLAQEKMQVLRDRVQCLEADLLAVGLRPKAGGSLAGATLLISEPVGGSSQGGHGAAVQGAQGGDDTGVAGGRDQRAAGGTTTLVVVPGVAVGGGAEAAGGVAAEAVRAAALEAVRKERSALQDRVAALQGQLAEARGALDLVGQPHAFLLQQLSTARAAERDAWAAAQAAQVAAAQREREAADAASERDALRRDLDTLLLQRQGLDKVKQLVMRAVGAGGTLGFGAQGSGGAFTGGGPVMLQGLGAAGTTTIVDG